MAVTKDYYPRRKSLRWSLGMTWALGWLKHCCVPWLTDALINEGCNGRQADWSDWSAATLYPSWKKRRFIAYAIKVRVQSVIAVLASNLGRRPLYSSSGESW